MREQVAWRLVDIHRPHVNVVNGAESLVETLVRNGVWLNSEDGTDTADEKFNVRQEDFDRLHTAGVFESDRELPIEDESEGPLLNASEHIDIAGNADGEENDVLTIGGKITPLQLDQLAEWQIIELVRSGTPVKDLLDQVDLSSDPAEAGRKLLLAENEVTGGEPRTDLVLGLAARLGSGEPSEPALESSQDLGGEDPAAPPLGEPQIQGEAPTAAVAAYLADHPDIDIDNIVGSGAGGRVTMRDVAEYEKSLSS